MTVKYFVTADGAYIGAFDGYLDEDGVFVAPDYPTGGIEVLGPPPSGDGRQMADPATGEWLDYTPPLPGLNRFRFEALVIALGLSTAALEAAINAMPISDFDKAVAISRLRNATTYNRDHPLVEQVRQQIGMSIADIDAAWLRAASLS